LIIKLSERKAGSAKKLVNYILDVKHDGKKASDDWSVNCEAENSYDLAILEMEAIHSLNTRSKSNLTWHLIVSFVEKDLSGEDLRNIEKEICGGLGMGDHQRVCVVHNDTANLHFHIALNRVNPETGRLANPSFYRRKLQTIGAAIEQKYNLTSTISDAIERGGGGNSDISFGWEKASGTKSFLSWVKENCASQVLSAKSWKQVHSSLLLQGVALKKRGNGLVFQSADKNYSVKASSVDREFSFSKLQDRFGPYVESKHPALEGAGYKKGRPYKDDTRLWSRYESLVSENKSNYARVKGALMARRNKARGEIQKQYSQYRFDVKNSSKRGAGKKSEYSLLRFRRLSALESVAEEYSKDLKQAKIDHPYVSWLGFLQEHAASGDLAATSLLKKMNKASYSGHPVEGQRKKGVKPFKKFAVNRYGDVEYTLSGGKSVIDTGRSIVLDFSLSEEVVDVGLSLALQTFGKNISVDNEKLRDMIEARIKDEKLSIILNGVSFEEGKQKFQMGR